MLENMHFKPLAESIAHVPRHAVNRKALGTYAQTHYEFWS